MRGSSHQIKSLKQRQHAVNVSRLGVLVNISPTICTLILCYPVFFSLPNFFFLYPCTYLSCCECFCAESGQRSYFPPPLWCKMPNGHAGLQISGGDRCKWSTVHNTCGTLKRNPYAHSSSEDLQLWDGISLGYQRFNSHYHSVNYVGIRNTSVTAVLWELSSTLI